MAGPSRPGQMGGLSSGDRLAKGKRLPVIKRLLTYLMRYKWAFLFAVALTIGSDFLSLIGPDLAGKAIDAMGYQSTDFNKVLYYAGLMVAFYVGYSVFLYLVNMLMISLSKKVVFNMRQDVFSRLASLPVSYFDNHQTGDIISRISYDIDTVNTSLSSDLVSVLASFTTIVGSFIMMLKISPRLILILFVTIPLALFTTKFITSRTQPLYRHRSRMSGELNGFSEEMISGQKTLKAYNREENVIEDFKAFNKNVVDAYYKTDYLGTLNGPSINFVNNLTISLISFFGALLFMNGGITPGNISSFVLYSRKFSGPINEIANIYGELQAALAAAERVFRILDEEPEKADAQDAKAISDVRGDVYAKDVNFGYIPEKPVLTDFYMNAPKGSLIALVGPTGAGKTTVINMLMRFYDIDSGEITLDGNDIYGLTRDSLRLSYSMVLQDTWLFCGTIAENIAYARPDATREEIIAAAKAAKIDDFIESLPNGYDTVLTDDASNISKGQKQLLTIARAMLCSSPMLILDEATSNVDTVTEVKIQQAMRELMRDKTCFVVAHRLSTIRHADDILVIDGGRVCEHGTHEELMAKNGAYSRLYRAQFE